MSVIDVDESEERDDPSLRRLAEVFDAVGIPPSITVIHSPRPLVIITSRSDKPPILVQMSGNVDARSVVDNILQEVKKRVPWVTRTVTVEKESRGYRCMRVHEIVGFIGRGSLVLGLVKLGRIYVLGGESTGITIIVVKNGRETNKYTPFIRMVEHGYTASEPGVAGWVEGTPVTVSCRGVGRVRLALSDITGTILEKTYIRTPATEGPWMPRIYAYSPSGRSFAVLFESLDAYKLLAYVVSRNYIDIVRVPQGVHVHSLSVKPDDTGVYIATRSSIYEHTIVPCVPRVQKIVKLPQLLPDALPSAIESTEILSLAALGDKLLVSAVNVGAGATRILLYNPSGNRVEQTLTVNDVIGGLQVSPAQKYVAAVGFRGKKWYIIDASEFRIVCELRVGEAYNVAWLDENRLMGTVVGEEVLLTVSRSGGEMEKIPVPARPRAIACVNGRCTITLEVVERIPGAWYFTHVVAKASGT